MQKELICLILSEGTSNEPQFIKSIITLKLPTSIRCCRSLFKYEPHYIKIRYIQAKHFLYFQSDPIFIQFFEHPHPWISQY